ncbi:3175_t:CDS:2, partial [Cetraspora pellucida]
AYVLQSQESPEMSNKPRKKTRSEYVLQSQESSEMSNKYRKKQEVLVTSSQDKKQKQRKMKSYIPDIQGICFTILRKPRDV